MNKNELKKILKPLIKECIKEVIFEEEGALSHIIKEVTAGLGGKQQITEAKIRSPNPRKNNNQQLKQRKKKLLDAIGRDAYGGINVFEGTTPAPPAVGQGQTTGPLSDVAPNDPGVDISNLFGARALAMSKKLMEKK
jgi:hypothetical protein